MLPVSGEEFFDNFLFEVLLKQDGVLKELAVNFFERNVFFLLLFLLIDWLGLFGFSFVGKSRDHSVIVIVFFLAFVLIF